MNNISAMVWDFDGTLVDTSSKNLNVTRKILQTVKPEIDPYQLPALKDLTSYVKASLKSLNWRDFYQKEFSLNEQETDLAGKLWTQFQLKDDTKIDFFPGLRTLFENLANIPQGIVSQNSKSNIIKLLEAAGLDKFFKEVFGYEEVNLQEQKPHPDGLIRCIDRLINSNIGTVFYIGDHETDIICAYNANKILRSKGIKVKSIAAFYDHVQDITSWKIQPDHIARKVSDITAIIRDENRT